MKIFHIWCNVNFGSVFFDFFFCIVYCSENRLKINRFWRVTVLKSFYR